VGSEEGSKNPNPVRRKKGRRKAGEKTNQGSGGKKRKDVHAIGRRGTSKQTISLDLMQKLTAPKHLDKRKKEREKKRGGVKNGIKHPIKEGRTPGRKKQIARPFRKKKMGGVSTEGEFEKKTERRRKKEERGGEE